MLLDGFKFDLRLYALLVHTGSNHTEVWLCRDGLVRLCSKKYEQPTLSNITQKMMHLANWSLNKRADEGEAEGRRAQEHCGRGERGGEQL